MPMIPFVGQSYTLTSRNFDCQRTVNLMPVMDQTQQGKAVSALIPTPGLKRFGDLGTSPVRGMVQDQRSGRVFAVYGATLTEIFEDGTHADIASLSTSEGFISMAGNGQQICIVDGENGYILRLEDNQFSPIVAEGWLGSYTVTFLDGYFVFVKPASQQIYISQPYSDPIEIDPLDFASAEGAPDNVMAAIGLKRQLWCFGSYTTEVWYDSGNADFPFQPIQGAFNQYGLLAPWSLALMDDTFFWLGRNDAGSTIVYCCEGFNARRISTDAVEQAMQGYPNPQNAVAYAYNQGGRSVYVINFPEANSTWAYDNTTGAWHERQYLNPISGKAERARAQYHIAAFNKHIVSDYADGRLYEMDLDTFSDDGDPIVRMRQSPHMAGPELERISYQEFQLDCQTGVGTPSGAFSQVFPQIRLSWSNDGGYTWSNEIPAGLGPAGAFTFRVIWRRLGEARDRVWRVTMTDPVPTTWIQARVIASPSIS